MGRQTLLLPVEWTKDGWYKIKECAALDKPVKLPALKPFKTDVSLNDSFEGTTLHPAWKFFGEYTPDRFELKDGNLTVKGKGNVIANSSPLLRIPTDHAYTAEVEMEFQGNSTGGLVLFYNEKASSGILANNQDVIANLRDWQFATKPGVVKNNHIYLRLKSKNNTVDMFYSLDGKNWIKIENSLEVSGLHHNVLSGFMSLKLGLCAIGDGSVIFKKFSYKPE